MLVIGCVALICDVGAGVLLRCVGSADQMAHLCFLGWLDMGQGGSLQILLGASSFFY